MLLFKRMTDEFSTYLASKKVFWWCRGERGKSGTIFFDLVVFLKFSVCSTKQKQTLLYCINHFDTKNWLIYLLKQDKNAQTALWSLCHSCPTTWGKNRKIGTSAPGATFAPFIAFSYPVYAWKQTNLLSILGVKTVTPVLPKIQL